MWWVTTFGILTVVAAIIAASTAVWLGWSGREGSTFRAVPAGLKAIAVLVASSVVIFEALAIVNAVQGRESVTVRYQPIWPALGYTVGDSVPDEIRLEYGQFSFAQLTTTYLISIAKVWSVVQHTSLIALALVLLFVVWKIAQSLQKGSFRGVLTSAALLRAGLCVIGLGVLWQGAAQTLQITIARMTHLKWEMSPMWPAEVWTVFGNITWPFTEIYYWPLVVGLVLIVAATAVKKSERDEAELQGLV
jgi:hypothetical protein